jgi:DNA-binding PadR family transcriptional regulator
MSRRPSSQTVSVLAALLEGRSDWSYGYELSRLVGVPSGTLYPILMRLTDRGHLETHWSEPEAPGRPARHMYRLTTNGRTWAADVVSTHRKHSSVVLRPVGETG